MRGSTERPCFYYQQAQPLLSFHDINYGRPLGHKAKQAILITRSVIVPADMCETVAGGLLSLPLALDVGDVAAGSSISKCFHMRPHTLITRHLNIYVSPSWHYLICYYQIFTFYSLIPTLIVESCIFILSGVEVSLT